MQLTLTRIDALERIRAERAWWDDLVARTSNDQSNDIKLTDDWTIRDFAAHLLNWWSWKMTRLEALAANKRMPEPPWPSTVSGLDEQNAWFDKQNRDLSMKEISDSYSQLYVLLEEIVTGLSEDELADRERFPFLEGRSLGDAIASGGFFAHSRETHAPQLAKWQDALGTTAS